MSDAFEDFLTAISSNELLQTVREESTAPIGGHRQPSDTLLDLIFDHFPDLSAACRSDGECLRALIRQQLRDGGFSTDIEEFKKQLKPIQALVAHMYDNTTTVRTYYVSLTKIFKDYFVKRGEGVKEGPFTKAFRSILKADTATTVADIQKRDRVLGEGLKNMYHVAYDKTAEQIRLHYDDAMRNDVLNNDQSMGLLVALEASCGSRKGAFLDPSIKFKTWKQYNKEKRELYFGTTSSVDVESDFHLEIPHPDRLSKNMDNVIVQIGVLKDADSAINKFLPDENDPRFVAPRVVVKPTIILSAKEVVDGVAAFRQVEDINARTFTTRSKMSSNYGGRKIRAVLDKIFPLASSDAREAKRPFGSHFARKFYANASYTIYKEQMQLATDKRIDRSVWMQAVLAHGGSVKTSLSYANVEVTFPMNPKLFSTPPEEQMKMILVRFNVMEAEIKKLRVMIAAGVPAESNKVKFTTTDGRVVFLPKINTRKRAVSVANGIKLLDDNRIKVTEANLLLLGFGADRIRKHRKAEKDGNAPQPSPPPPPPAPPAPAPRAARAPAAAPAVVPAPAPAAPAAAPKAHLVPEGAKVIAPEGKDERRTEQNLKRDIARFGAENVIANEEDCEGRVEKKRKIDGRMVRDLCYDE